LTVERKGTVSANGAATSVDELSIITPTGQLRRFELTPAIAVRVADPELGRELSRYLSVVGSARSRDFRRMIISARGTGERELSLSYISEVPVWKSTYRLVLPDGADKSAMLQGWAVVDNTIGDDWSGVKLSLVAGAPQSFVQEISQPYYLRRPVIENPSEVSTMPQAHEGTMETAAAVPFLGGMALRTALRGVVTDAQGAVVPGAQVLLRNGSTGETQRTTTDSSGNYTFAQAPVGNVAIEVEANGFQKTVLSQIFLAAGQMNEVSTSLKVGAAATEVEVTAAAPMVETNDAQLSTFSGNADAARRGDVFEYAIPEPVTIAKNQSALVPIVQKEIAVEKVTLWNPQQPQALHAVWITNGTGLTLDGGSFEVLDHGAFAGEGIMATVHPEEKRLLSYAADRAVSVVAQGAGEDEDEDEAVKVATRVRIAHGDIHIIREQHAAVTYTIHNADTSARTVVIEHPLRSGWKLAGAAKPEETSTGAYRFKESVAPGATKKLVVATTRPGEESFSFSNVTDEMVAGFLQEATVSPATAEAIKAFAGRKRAIAELDAEMQAKNKEMESIGADQGRLRENMKALRGSAEERSLLQRYTRQLNEQEDRIAALRGELAAVKARRDQLQTQLNADIERFVVDEKL
jgi:hypothetical protein